MRILHSWADLFRRRPHGRRPGADRRRDPRADEREHLPVRRLAADRGARFIAGGTNLLDLMKENVVRPTRLIDISRLPLNRIADTADGGLRIDALVPNSDVAYHPQVEKRYPLLAGAILAGASPQLRNMASTGGNLLQRTRC